MIEKLTASRREVAEMLGVNVRIVDQMLLTGELPKLDLPGRLVKIPLKAVHDLIDESMQAAS